MKLKVCGMKYQENIAQVAGLSPDYLGFIFYEKTLRHFKEQTIAVPSGIKKIGVFVAEPTAVVLEKIKTFKLDAVQLHGNESPEYCADLIRLIANSGYALDIEIIKVFSIKNEFNFNELKPFEDLCNFFLFDTKGEQPGGNGFTFDWSVLNDYPSTKPFFLSGGIGLNQVKEVESFLSSSAAQYCHALDVNSKFEDAPGLKNIEHLIQFKNTLKEKNILS